MKCRQCRKKVPDFAPECPYCHAPMESKGQEVTRYLEEINATLEKAEEQEQKRQQRIHRKRKPFVFTRRKKVVLAGLLIAAIIAGQAYIREMRVWHITDNTITYLTDTGLITENLKSGRKMKLQSFKLTSSADQQISNLYINQYIYYHEAKAKDCIYYAGMNEESESDGQSYVTLYKQDCKNQYAKAEVVAEKVASAVVDREDNLYYRTGEDDVVIKYDGETKQEISVPGLSDFMYNELADQVYVTTVDKSLFGKLEDTNEDPEYVSEVFRINWDKKILDKMFSMSDFLIDFNGEKNLYYIYKNALYKYDVDSGASEEIARNVQRFSLERSEDKEILYYSQYKLEDHTYYDMVVDSHAKEDASSGKKDECFEEREKVREKLKGTPLATMTSTLYCYEDGVSTKMADNLCDPVSQQLVGVPNVYTPTVSELRQVKPEYKLRMNGTDTIESIEEYYQQGTDQYMIRIEMLFDWYKEEGIPIRGKVIYEENYEDLRLENKKVVESKTIADPIDKELFTKTANGQTYYYSVREGCLKKKIGTQSYKDETVAANVFAYRLLEDGTLVYMASQSTGTKYDLYEIDTSGKTRTIARNVWGLFGKDTCNIADSCELDQVNE